MTEPIRLCCNCKYYKKDWISHLTGSGDIFDRCFNPTLYKNVVTRKNEGTFCIIARRHVGVDCGKEGVLWEAR